MMMWLIESFALSKKNLQKKTVARKSQYTSRETMLAKISVETIRSINFVLLFIKSFSVQRSQNFDVTHTQMDFIAIYCLFSFWVGIKFL